MTERELDEYRELLPAPRESEVLLRKASCHTSAASIGLLRACNIVGRMSRKVSMGTGANTGGSIAPQRRQVRSRSLCV